MAMMASPKATIDCVRAFGETDFRADMKAFTVPTLVVHGSDDKTVPFEASGQRAAAAILQAELKVYDGAPHALVFTEKDRLNSDLRPSWAAERSRRLGDRCHTRAAALLLPAAIRYSRRLAGRGARVASG